MEDTEDPFYYNKTIGIYEPAEPLVKMQFEKLQPGVITDTVNNVIHKLALCERTFQTICGLALIVMILLLLKNKHHRSYKYIVNPDKHIGMIFLKFVR
jgi:hypothetical protein